MISTEKKAKIVTDMQRHKTDTASPAIQAGLATKRIEEITAHLKANPKDHMARRGLLQLVGKRKKQLKYLAQEDSQNYLETIKKLGLRR